MVSFNTNINKHEDFIITTQATVSRNTWLHKYKKNSMMKQIIKQGLNMCEAENI